MRLKFPNHCQDRISERNLNIDDIKAAILAPDSQIDRPQGRVLVYKKVNEKVIKVIYCKEGFRDKKDEYTVITALYTSK